MVPAQDTLSVRQKSLVALQRNKYSARERVTDQSEASAGVGPCGPMGAGTKLHGLRVSLSHLRA